MSKTDEEIDKLKKLRAGKKGSITKRVNQLRRLVSEGGSRTRIKFLYEALLKVHSAVTTVCEQITALTQQEQADYDWLEDVNHVVDECSAEVLQYLEDRKDDEASVDSLTRSWIETHSLSIHDQPDVHQQDEGIELNALMDNILPPSTRPSPPNHTDDPRGLGALFTAWENQQRLPASSCVDPINPAWNPTSSAGFPPHTLGPQFASWRGNDKTSDESEATLQRFSNHQSSMFNISQPVMSWPKPILRPQSLFPRFDPLQSHQSHPTPGFSSAHRSEVHAPKTVFSSTAAPPAGGSYVHSKNLVNEVDSWIDLLDENQRHQIPKLTDRGISADLTMAWLVQQSLPRSKIPIFDGSALSWVPFVTKFHTLVHNQAVLTDEQRSMYLLDHLDGEAKRSVSGYAPDTRGYIMALKRLKFLFGQNAKIAQAYLAKVIRGKQVPDDDVNGLTEFFYTVSDCLVVLRQLNYASDLFSSDTLRQAVRRLPSKFNMKWAEQSLRLRERSIEPNLIDFERWLQSRVLAYKESYRPEKRNSNNNNSNNKPKEKESLIGATMTYTVKCSFCDGKHKIGRCDSFAKLGPSEKFEAAKKKNLCFNCLGASHQSPSCRSRNTCFISGCSDKHHTSLHEHFITQEKGTKEEKSSYNAMVRSAKKDIFLQVVPVVLHGSTDTQTVTTYALLDDGSESTLLRADIAKKLHLRGNRQFLNVSTVVEKSREPIPSKEVKLNVSSLDRKFNITMDSVSVVPAERFNMPGRPPLEDSDYFTHMDDIDVSCVAPEEITLLIGADQPEAHLHSEVRRGRKGQPLLVKTKFGWTPFGSSKSRSPNAPGHVNTVCTNVSHLHVLPVPSRQVHSLVEQLWADEVPSKSTRVNLVASSTNDDNLHNLVESFWQQEHSVILPRKDTAPSVEDLQLLQKLETETKLVDGHYCVPMLWDEKIIQLPNNISQAKRRFEFLQKRLRSNPELYKQYDAVFRDYMAKGYARRMTTDEAVTNTRKTRYLPHSPVYNPNKPGKIRVVNDAAAKFRGISLNDALKTGPDLLNSLVGVIMRLRTGPVAIAADLESMFHQVTVPLEDRDSLRFLWIDDIFSNDDPHEMQMNVHIFGAKDSPTCANYAVKRCARDNQHDFDPLTFETALNGFYVDDLLKSVDSDDSAITLAKQLIDMMKRGGFRLTKFLSNSKAVIDALPQSEVSPNISFKLDTGNIQRALGISWDVVSDRFTFILNPPTAPLTKRGILQITCSLFDPLGLVVPFIVTAKILLQELWRRDYGWDEKIDDESVAFWKKWLEGAKNVTKVYVDRCYHNFVKNPVLEVQLHIFSDASERAYGSVAYLRFTFKAGGHTCSFVMAKSKLAPIKTITLPRLELNAAVTGVRMYKNIIREIDLPVTRICFWSDSTLTLQYITNTKHRPKVYVANRQSEINEATDIADWRHVPGGENPADLLTRGVTDPGKLMETSSSGMSWLSGPAFLSEDESCWPTAAAIHHLDPDDPEVKKKSVLVGLGFVEDNNIIDSERFSTWTKLRRVVGWVRRFLHNYVATQKSKPEDLISGDLSCEEMAASEAVILKHVQRDSFSDELRALKRKETLSAKSKLSPLSPYVDSSGMLRVGGRLKNAKITPAAKHQLILPKDHPVTKLIIVHDHRLNGHVGREHVLANLRERYWVVNGRAAVKSVLRKCFFCRFRRARRQYPYMSDLPHGRVAYGEPPFSHCGVDLFGPIMIKQGRKRLKRWGVLYTCLTVRCVHLEVVESLETDDFINCLRRFVNRRGCPKFMYSDCGTNFKGATTELTDAIQLLDHGKIEQYATSQKIVWSFNPPSAPHMGGAWERLVRSTKEVLSGLMQEKVLTDAQLYTLLTEVENILNRRPLTHMSDDIEDLGAITPNHILIGMHRNWDYACDTDDQDVSSRRKFRQVQAIANQFWMIWRREYLPQLTKRECWRTHISNYKVGELVVLVDNDQRRGKWSLARITKVLPGDDDVVRVVEVRTKDGVYTRPVAKVCRLEDD